VWVADFALAWVVPALVTAAVIVCQQAGRDMTSDE